MKWETHLIDIWMELEEELSCKLVRNENVLRAKRDACVRLLKSMGLNPIISLREERNDIIVKHPKRPPLGVKMYSLTLVIMPSLADGELENSDCAAGKIYTFAPVPFDKRKHKVPIDYVREVYPAEKTTRLSNPPQKISFSEEDQNMLKRIEKGENPWS